MSWRRKRPKRPMPRHGRLGLGAGCDRTVASGLSMESYRHRGSLPSTRRLSWSAQTKWSERSRRSRNPDRRRRSYRSRPPDGYPHRHQASTSRPDQGLQADVDRAGLHQHRRANLILHLRAAAKCQRLVCRFLSESCFDLLDATATEATKETEAQASQQRTRGSIRCYESRRSR